MSGDAYGRRARIGFIGPSAAAENNPYEFYRMAPEGVTIVLAHVGVEFREEVEASEAFLAGLAEPAGELGKRKVDVVVQAGVPYVVAGGPGFDQRVIQHLREVAGVPATSDIVACADALAALDVRRVALVTPFTASMNERVADYLGARGITVGADALVARVPGIDLSTTALSIVQDTAQRAFVAAGDAQGVLINGARMPSVAVIDALERELGVPVVTSMQAMTWAGLRLAGVEDRIAGYGRLLQLA